MNAVQPFFFGEAEVRAYLDENGEPWFVAKDVCAVLEIANHKDAVSRLDEDERGGSVIPTPLGGPQEMLTVSESGLYALIFTSRKEAAKRFRKWVTGEVLPALRRTGRYETPRKALPEIPASVRRIKPSYRTQVLSCAVQAAKMDGGDVNDVYGHFLNFCELVSLAPGREELQALELAQKRLFMRFAEERMVIDPGAMTQMRDLWIAFMAWFDEKACSGELDMEQRPSLRRFGEWMQARFQRYRSNVIFYLGVRLARVDEAAA